MAAVDQMRDEIVAMERRRRLYTFITVVVVAAVILAGYDTASDMNSGSFFRGLQQFFDYPGDIVIEPGSRPRLPRPDVGIRPRPDRDAEHRGVRHPWQARSRRLLAAPRALDV
jgi:hypothetical protein